MLVTLEDVAEIVLEQNSRRLIIFFFGGRPEALPRPSEAGVRTDRHQPDAIILTVPAQFQLVQRLWASPADQRHHARRDEALWRVKTIGYPLVPARLLGGRGD